MRISDWSSDVCSSDLLVGEDIQRVLAVQRLQPALRHREGIVAEVDLLLVLVILEHREVDDPAELEDVLLADIKFIADADTRLPSQLSSRQFLVTGKEDRIAVLHVTLLPEQRDAVGLEELGHRAFQFPIIEDEERRADGWGKRGY